MTLTEGLLLVIVLLLAGATISIGSCGTYLRMLLQAEDVTRRALLTELMKVREAAERGNRR